MEVNKPALIIIILAISLTTFFLFALPKYQDSKRLELDLAQKQSQYEGLVNYYLGLSDILNKIQQQKDVLDKINSALPTNFTLSPVVEFLQQKAEEANLTIKAVTFSQQQALGSLASSGSNMNVKDVNLKIDLSGSYQGIKEFLASLENSARIFEVDSISFTSDQAVLPKNSSQSYDFLMNIKTHTY